MKDQRVKQFIDGLANLVQSTGIVIDSTMEICLHDWQTGRYLGVVSIDDDAVNYHIDPNDEPEFSATLEE